MEIISCQEAKRLGLKYYFTGEPCKNGHISKRRVKKGDCVACNRSGPSAKRKEKRRSQTEAYKERQRAKASRSYARNREAILARAKLKYTKKRAAILADSDKEQLRLLADKVLAVLEATPPKLIESKQFLAGKVVMSRADALLFGLTTYFSGVPCSMGHVSDRFTCNSNCVDCRKARKRMRRKFLTDEQREEMKCYGRQKWRERHRESSTRYWVGLFNSWPVSKTPEKQKEYAERGHARLKARLELDHEFRVRYMRKQRESTAKWRLENPHKKRASDAKRRATKRNAQPAWLTPEQLAQMEAIYAEAREVEDLLGCKMHVDHIYPLQHKEMCGLHVPWNLQILTASQNVVKHNRTPEEMARIF